MNIFNKLNHWTIFFLTLFLVVTGVFGCTILHYSTIIPNLELAYGVNEIQNGIASQKYIARVIRGAMWDWHYYSGWALATLMLVGMFSVNNKYSFKKNPFPLAFILMVVVLFITGWIRYHRGELSFTTEDDKFWRNLARSTHHYTAWAFGILSALHVAHIVYLNNTKLKSIISNMFTSGNFLLRSVALVSALSVSFVGVELNASEQKYDAVTVITKRVNKHLEDKNYQEAMEYYKGKKGFWIEERTFPNCPYDACDQPTEEVKFKMKDGSKYYDIKIHNFLEARKYFDISVEKTKNPLSAEKNILMVMERINYKDKYFDDYLMEHVTKSLGFTKPDEIREYVKKNIALIGPTNSLKMLYKCAEVYEYGFFNMEVNKERAKLMYEDIVKQAEETGKTETYYCILAKNKIKTLSNG